MNNSKVFVFVIRNGYIKIQVGPGTNQRDVKAYCKTVHDNEYYLQYVPHGRTDRINISYTIRDINIRAPYTNCFAKQRIILDILALCKFQNRDKYKNGQSVTSALI
jgi:hypothetical protein